MPLAYLCPMDILQILSKPIQKGKNVFIAPNATVIGNVSLGDECSVWFGAVLRADSDSITIGHRTNIQDNAVIHVDPNEPATIGNDCIIGHLALVHGATIGDNVLVGMHSTVMNGAKVGDFSIIGANALVPAGMEIPAFSMVVGTPAKIVKTLTPEQVEKVKRNAAVYVELAAEYMEFYK